MKILHVADLHIGKRVNEFSMLEDQRYILRQIAALVERHSCGAVLVAGDIYDRSTPAAEAVPLLDDFLTALSARGATVMMISGNHDSPERLDFASRILQKQNVYIAGSFDQEMRKVTLCDEYGAADFYLLPFVRPSQVRHAYPEAAVESYQDAVRLVLEQTPLDHSRRNVLVAHQFVTAGGREPERCDSEYISVGGQDNVAAELFDAFDYVALGHLHGPQQVGRETVRYAGSPLKYSFSEARQKKSVSLVELKEKGRTEITLLPLAPIHELREIKGRLSELTAPETVAAAPADDYLRVTLTDQEPLLDAMSKLRAAYPNIMKLDFENRGREAGDGDNSPAPGARRDPLDLFREFYRLQWNAEPEAEMCRLVEEELKRLGEERP